MSGHPNLILSLGPLTAATLASSHQPPPPSCPHPHPHPRPAHARPTAAQSTVRPPTSRPRVTHARISVKSRQPPLVGSQSVTVARRARTWPIFARPERNPKQTTPILDVAFFRKLRTYSSSDRTDHKDSWNLQVTLPEGTNDLRGHNCT